MILIYFFKFITPSATILWCHTLKYIFLVFLEDVIMKIDAKPNVDTIIFRSLRLLLFSSMH